MKIGVFLILAVGFATSVAGAQSTKGEKKDAHAVLRQIEEMCSSHREMRDVQAPAAKQMQSMGPIQKEDIPFLVNEASTREKDWKYRFFVLRRLADVHDGRITAPAIQALNDEKKEIRITAAYILGKSGDSASVQPLIDRLDDADKHVRIAVGKGLGLLKDRKAVAPLIARLQKEQDFVVRTNLIESGLGVFKDDSVADQLITSLTDSHPDVRATAARMLDAYGGEKVDRALVQAIKDSHPLVRLYAAQSLGAQARGKEALETLAEREKQEREDFVLRAIRAAKEKAGQRIK